MKLIIDFEGLKKMRGLVFTYYVNKDGILIDTNAFLQSFYKETLGIQDMLGKPLIETFKCLGGNYAEQMLAENEEVMRDGIPKVFFNTAILIDIYKVDFLTIKIPYYDDNGNVEGTVGFSQLLTRFSVADALKFKFTQKEIECISHMLDGKSAKETAEIMGISRRTVEFHIENIKNKLGCSTKAEVIAKCICFKEDTLKTVPINTLVHTGKDGEEE